jgi:predicted secreted hydrolase
MRRRPLLALPAALLGVHAMLPRQAQAQAQAPAGAAGLRPRPLVFPRDHGAHPDARTEWWYITGALSGAANLDSPAFGFQVTFFRTRTDIGPHPSRFAARQLVFAHAAVTDLARGRLQHDQRIARAGFGIAEASVHDTDLVLRGWHLKREALGAGSRYHAQVGTGTADRAEVGFDLVFDTTQPLLLQGDQGWSRKGPDPAQASHYYSQPQLQVSGRLLHDGRWQRMQGRAWLDHEWSDTLLHPQAVGWDWIGMNLLDGGALTAFRLRRADGSSVWSGGSLRPAAGSPLAATAFEGGTSVRFTPGRSWTSPATGTRYPVEWNVDTPGGRFRVRALADAQELDSRNSTGSVYWEGLSELLSADGGRVGIGYLEMTGYASALRL